MNSIGNNLNRLLIIYCSKRQANSKQLEDKNNVKDYEYLMQRQNKNF